MAYKRTYNPCDDCQYGFTRNNQESNMCKICEFRQLLDKTTADVAEVVRCKDCKYYHNDEDGNLCELLIVDMKEQDFCSYGKRKGGTE